MNGYNKVIMAGNLTRDPELRYTQNGSAIATCALALNRKWNSDGEQKQETTFVDWKSFGNTAATAAEHLRKGQCVLIDGRLNLEQWESHDGNKRSKLIVIAEHITFLPNGNGNAEPDSTNGGSRADQSRTGTPANRPTNSPKPERARNQRRAERSEEDDVPF